MSLKAAEHVAVLAGGARSVITFTPADLLSFFYMKGARVLRAVSSDLRDAAAAFTFEITWNDSEGHFPSAPW
jgi:hypothetical protein